MFKRIITIIITLYVFSVPTFSFAQSRAELYRYADANIGGYHFASFKYFSPKNKLYVFVSDPSGISKWYNSDTDRIRWRRFKNKILISVVGSDNTTVKIMYSIGKFQSEYIEINPPCDGDKFSDVHINQYVMKNAHATLNKKRISGFSPGIFSEFVFRRYE
ncbi:MAG: hypothetical protein ACL93V_16935 [Candidatus Electrothrix sp. YB6]